METVKILISSQKVTIPDVYMQGLRQLLSPKGCTMEAPSPSYSGSVSASEERDARIGLLLQRRQELTDSLAESPYDFILFLDRAVVYSDLGYPDLAAGDAYRALLLTDEAKDESYEYHDQVVEALENYSSTNFPKVLYHGTLSDGAPELFSSQGLSGPGIVNTLASLAAVRCFQILSLCLLLCGSLRSAWEFCERGLKAVPDNQDLLEIKSYIERLARRRLQKADNEPVQFQELPDRGVVRREVYPWNTYEPDRFSKESLSFLNSQLASMAPKCEVRVSKLPVLLDGASSTDGYDIIPTCNQLGLFAKEDIAPGEVVLQEYTPLTVNNRHKDSNCDACGSVLPPLTKQGTTAICCLECDDTVFCDEFCYNKAQELYHPAVCNKDMDAIAKDPDATVIEESLYLLLLARLLAMSAHQDIHPLDVIAVKYIWGDFVPPSVNDIDLSVNAEPPPEWTLPFSFKYNIETPLHILEKMDIDIFANLDRYDTWVFNTAYAKFRGTASARKSYRDGRPDVAAVHPFWCLANHDCNPNVTWEWGGKMTLYAMKTRLGDQPGGIKAGEEIFNHYCDITLDVQSRREWAKGSLGGWCMCQRCRDEAEAKGL